jgi:two-component system sensor histidine kinase BaeS
LFGCFVLAVLAVAFLTGGLLGAFFGGWGPGPGGWWSGPGGPHPFLLLPILLIIALIVIATAGGVRRMTRPMDNLIDAAQRIESGDYSAQVPEWGSPDIRSVARAFNSMSARLKAMDEQRRSFMADVTHELRTPLSVIRGQAEAIADGVYPADASHLAPILDATATLDRLVDDLRTLVLTDAGSLILHEEPTDIGGLVRDTVESFRSQAESKGMSLTTEIAANVPTIDVDAARIRQVIGNLLSNAIRHTPSGGSVRVAVNSAGDDVTVSVADNGEGIPPDLLPHVFERFVKGTGSTGSGLGLAIAHDIVSAHGGRLTVDSAVGRGTTVRIEIKTSSAP